MIHTVVSIQSCWRRTFSILFPFTEHTHRARVKGGKGMIKIQVHQQVTGAFTFSSSVIFHVVFKIRASSKINCVVVFAVGSRV